MKFSQFLIPKERSRPRRGPARQDEGLLQVQQDKASATNSQIQLSISKYNTYIAGTALAPAGLSGARGWTQRWGRRQRRRPRRSSSGKERDDETREGQKSWDELCWLSKKNQLWPLNNNLFSVLGSQRSERRAPRRRRTGQMRRRTAATKTATDFPEKKSIFFSIFQTFRGKKREVYLLGEQLYTHNCNFLIKNAKRGGVGFVGCFFHSVVLLFPLFCFFFLDLGHCGDVARLNVVLELGYLKGIFFFFEKYENNFLWGIILPARTVRRWRPSRPLPRT